MLERAARARAGARGVGAGQMGAGSELRVLQRAMGVRARGNGVCTGAAAPRRAALIPLLPQPRPSISLPDPTRPGRWRRQPRLLPEERGGAAQPGAHQLRAAGERAKRQPRGSYISMGPVPTSSGGAAGGWMRVCAWVQACVGGASAGFASCRTAVAAAEALAHWGSAVQHTLPMAQLQSAQLKCPPFPRSAPAPRPAPRSLRGGAGSRRCTRPSSCRRT